MRKVMKKQPKEEKRLNKRPSFSNKKLNILNSNFIQIPVFSSIDDEEYFFEVEDY